MIYLVNRMIAPGTLWYLDDDTMHGPIFLVTRYVSSFQKDQLHICVF